MASFQNHFDLIPLVLRLKLSEIGYFRQVDIKCMSFLVCIFIDIHTHFVVLNDIFLNT